MFQCRYCQCVSVPNSDDKDGEIGDMTHMSLGNRVGND
jgi:hypothetical protein